MKLPISKWNLLRLHRLLAKIFMGKYNINHNKIIIDITYECYLRCFGCNRSCRQAPTNERMSVEQIGRFIDESVRQKREWKEILLEGGEPTLHPNLHEIVNMLLEYRADHSPNSLVILATNGYGPQVNDVLNSMPEQVVIYNSMKKSPVRPDYHSFNTAPVDLPRYRTNSFSAACHIPSFYGIGLTRYGFYPCAVSGGIDRVLGLDMGLKQMPESGDRMEPLLKVFCGFCGNFIRFNQVTKIGEMSESWIKAYKNYRIKKPQLTLY